MRWIIFLGLAGLVSAAPAMARDRPNPFSSGEAAVAYAIDPGCLTWLRMGGDIKTALGHGSRPLTEDGRAVRKVYGLGHVTVVTDTKGGCYIRARHGEADRLRETVVNTLAETGLKVERLPANAALDGRNWAFRHEVDCFRMDEQVFLVEIYTGTGNRALPLQATLSRDGEGMAARHGLCQG